jgi:hypothetical protein
VKDVIGTPDIRFNLLICDFFFSLLAHAGSWLPRGTTRWCIAKSKGDNGCCAQRNGPDVLTKSLANDRADAVLVIDAEEQTLVGKIEPERRTCSGFSFGPMWTQHDVVTFVS